MRMIAIAALLTATGNAAQAQFYLNVCCSDGGRYTIMRYEENGQPVPPEPVIHGGVDPDGALHFAWPSAVEGGGVRLWASRFIDGRWQDVASWKASDGINFRFEGISVEALPEEAHGIGPSQVYVAPGEGRPYKMIFLVRGSNGTVGSQLAQASSATGEPGSWVRDGIVMEASEPWEAAGIAPSFVTQAKDGRWVLAYQAYETLETAHAAIAISDSPDGPWTDKQVIMPANGVSIAVSEGKRGINTVVSAAKVEIGVPHVLRTTEPDRAVEVVVPVHQAGDVVYFRRPLLFDHPTAEMVHIAAMKPDPSYIYQLEDGSWRGIFTGYGHFSGVMSEYTFSTEAPKLSGPWTIRPDGVPFQPWVAGGIQSTENPTPILSGP